MAVTVEYSRDTSAETEFNTWTSGTQTYNDVLAFANGNYVGAYITENGGADDNYILLDFYNAAGVHLTSTHGYAIPYTPFNPSSSVEAVGDVSLTLLANGNALVIWDDNVSGDTGMRGAIFNSTGGVVSLEIDLADSPVFEDLDVAALTDGNFVVTYGSNTVDNVFFRMFSAAGAGIGGITTVNTALTGIQRDAQTVGLSGGGFVVTWTDETGDGFFTDDYVKARIFNNDGSARTGELSVGLFGSNDNSAVAATKDGGFVVVYTDTGWTTQGITLQVFDSAGTEVVSTQRVDEADGNPVKDADVTVLSNGFYVVTWSQDVGGGDFDLYAAVFDTAGQRVQVGGANVFLIDNDGSGDQEINSALAGLLGGNFITTWQDGTTDIRTETNEIIRTSTGDGDGNTITGDSLRDIIDGAGGNDVLNGGLGADSVHGGLGDDLMYVDNAGDTATEGVGEGDDTVVASRSWAVASNIERVILTGSGDFNVAGNGIANNLKGNSGDNWLNGSFGKDVLTGGGGRDSFIFNRTLGSNNIDTITDYDVPRDVIRIDNAVFAGIGPAGALAAGAFHIGVAAHDADDRIIYDQTTGKLFFDIDGLNGNGQVQFATLSTKPVGMTAAEFIII